MTIINKEKGFELQKVTDNCYQVIDSNGDSHGYKDTLRKATNLFNRIISYYN